MSFEPIRPNKTGDSPIFDFPIKQGNARKLNVISERVQFGLIVAQAECMKIIFYRTNKTLDWLESIPDLRDSHDKPRCVAPSCPN